MTSRTRLAPMVAALFALGAPLASLAVGACGPSSAPDPFAFDPGFIPPDGGGGAGGGSSGSFAGSGGADPELGGPCVDDGQCDDDIDCTLDACDMKELRCRFTPDDSACQNDIYCDGIERCSTKLGCVPGEPIGCSDMTPCTVDKCDEATKACVQKPRDADDDGDPDGHCPGGDDCDDNDPTVSSLVPEVCSNGKDDNCDGQKDEAVCSKPSHDTCSDPVEISSPGSYALDTTGASFNYATSCSSGDPAMLRDVVAAILLPAGPPVDVELTTRTAFADSVVTVAGQCGDAATELACGASFPAVGNGKIAKAIGRALGDPSMPTAYPVYVTMTQGGPVTLDVAFLEPTPAPANETCGSAEPITPSVPIKTQIIDAAADLGSKCATQLGDLVYTFDLAQTSNVDVYAASIDGDGNPSLSLRGPGCALPEDEITCQTAANAHVFWQSLPAGTYYVSVSASAPTTALITLEVSAPTSPAPDDTCATAPPIEPNKTIVVDPTNHQDDVQTGCLAGAADAVYALDLAETSDVLLVQRISQGDVGGVELELPACADPTDELACGTGAYSPLRAAKHAVPAGSYRVVGESLLSQPMQLTAFVRKAVPTTLVPFADGCADALAIPPEGGFFQGNTANASADFSAGCDQGGVAAGGAPEQLLKLVLPSQKRVILEMAGSGYQTLLDVRKGPACPGVEVAQGCTVGFSPRRAFLDLDLDAGTYFIQIDGYGLDAGPWFLDVRVVAP